MIIGISGKAGHGKDTVGRMLQYCFNTELSMAYSSFLLLPKYQQHPYSIVKFASTLKWIVALVTDTRVDFIECNKSALMSNDWSRVVQLTEFDTDDGVDGFSSIPYTYREFLQQVGSKLREVHPDFWINSLTIPDNCIITDVRYRNEVDHILSKKGKLIRVNGHGFTGDHPSETELDDYPFEYILHNTSTVDNLLQQVIMLYKSLI